VTGDLGPTAAAADRDVYARLIADLDAAGCRYRLIDHAPEGRTEVVSALRGHALAHAAKCLIHAGRPDRSVALASEDYVRLAGPRIARIIAT
jgi:hypothetical protein